MKTGTILAEVLAIAAIALILGTGVHLLRPDKKKRIEWVKEYKDVYLVKPHVDPPGELPTPSKPVKKSDPAIARKAATKETDPANSAQKITGQPKTSGQEVVLVQDPPGQEKANDPPDAPPESTEGPVRMILIDEAKALFEEGDIPFLDARRTRFYEKGHIPRAISLSVWEAALDERISALLDRIPQEMPVVVYCMSANCEDSHMLADALKSAGYQDIRILKGGFPEWQKKKLEFETGSGREEQQ